MFKLRIMAIILALIVYVGQANAQTASDDILDLDPNIIAAAICNGSIFALSMFNYENEILSEERARIMTRTITLAFWLTATKHQSVEHLIEHADSYDEFLADSYESTYDDLMDGNFTWDSQAEIDKCIARVFDPLTSVTERDLERSGIENYFDFMAEINKEADIWFDYILRLMEAMQ